MNEILVIGHRNPDTDAICSAIGYAEFKRRTGMDEAVAARCGDTNERIDFVLNTFGVPAPKFVADVSPKVSDVMQRRILSVRPDSTAAEALRLMDEKNLRILPVLGRRAEMPRPALAFQIEQVSVSRREPRTQFARGVGVAHQPGANAGRQSGRRPRRGRANRN